MYPQLGALAWCHVCINWGFFILQSWLPVYLAKELGFSLGGSGLVAALPWFLTAACSFSSGQIADFLVAKGWTRWKVRRLMMNIATIGPATAKMEDETEWKRREEDAVVPARITRHARGVFTTARLHTAYGVHLRTSRERRGLAMKVIRPAPPVRQQLMAC